MEATIDTTQVRRWKRYGEMQELPLDWDLTLPAHWETHRLKEIADVRPSNVDKKTVEGESAVLLCNYVDVYKNDEVTDSIDFMEASASQAQIDNFSIEAGDVVITKDSEDWSDIAVPTYVPNTISNLVCGYHLALIRPRTELISGRYLAHCFEAAGISDQFRVAANGITRFGLGTQELRCAVFPVPPLEEQGEIVKFLKRETNRIDNLVAQKKKLIDLLHEKRLSVNNFAVTRGLNPDAPTQDSGCEIVGHVPSHWRPTKIKHLFRFCKRQNFPNETVLSVYRDFGVIEKSSRDDNHNRTPADVTSYQLVEPGDLVINKMKAWQGSLGISSLRGITSPDYVVYQCQNNEHQPYLHHLLRSRQMATAYFTISNGIRNDQWRVETDKFESRAIFLPPPDEQKAIAEFISQTLSEVRLLRKRITDGIGRLQEYRTALISAAVTGQIDVREEVAASDG